MGALLWSALLGLLLFWVMSWLMLGDEIMSVPIKAVGRFIKRLIWPPFRPVWRAIARFCDKHADGLFKAFFTFWIIAGWAACSWIVYGLLFA